MSDKEKPTFRQKWRTRANDTKRLMREPGYAKEYFPGIFVRAWRTRGGGWYGIGYLVTFIYLEIAMTIGEISEASSPGDYLGGSLWGLFPRWLGESLANMVQSFLWPLTLVEWLGGLLGAAALLAIHFGFVILSGRWQKRAFLSWRRIGQPGKRRSAPSRRRNKKKESDTC